MYTKNSTNSFPSFQSILCCIVGLSECWHSVRTNSMIILPSKRICKKCLSHNHINIMNLRLFTGETLEKNVCFFCNSSKKRARGFLFFVFCFLFFVFVCFFFVCLFVCLFFYFCFCFSETSNPHNCCNRHTLKTLW